MVQSGLGALFNKKSFFKLQSFESLPTLIIVENMNSIPTIS